MARKGDTTKQTAAPDGYAAALAELDAILRELDDPELDIDRLGAQVRRAAELVAFCRLRIEGARADVDAVAALLDGDDTADDTDDED